MSGVAGRAVGALVEAAIQYGLDEKDLLEGSALRRSDLARPNKRYEWDLFCDLIERIDSLTLNPCALVEIGREVGPSRNLRILRIIGRTVYHPRDIYFMGAKWLGPSIFPMVEATIKERPDGVIVQQLTLQSEHRDCPGIFRIFQGAFAQSPISWGHGPSEIEVTIEPRRATFFIRPNATQLSWFSRRVRSLRAKRDVGYLAAELEEQSATIHSSYREIRDARDKIAAQAADLEQINSFGQRLSKEIELDRVVQVVTHKLMSDLDYVGVEIELSLVTDPNPPDSAHQTKMKSASETYRRREGDPFGSPTVYRLESGGRSLGQLHLWPSGASTKKSQSDLLVQRLIPWITMALDNARTYRVLEDYAAELQTRVEERTSRLLAVNHQLVREIDERKRANEALIESEAQLRASERLASIGTLAAGIAHEINNPIGSILAAAQFATILAQADSSESALGSESASADRTTQSEVQEALLDITNQAKRCGNIVRSVLQFSRDERTEKWNVPLGDIICRSVRLVEAEARSERAEIESYLPEIPTWAHVNPIQIEQAIVNLVRNAMEAGSTLVTVTLEDHAAEGLATIEVADNGSGIASKDRTRIFEPFYTTKLDDGGTGLGLSVVHGIAAQHEGTLKVESSDQGGVAALLEIPTVHVPSDDAETDERKQQDAPA